MKRSTGKRSLEGYKIFPYIAWMLVCIFALFVYNLTNEVTEATERLQHTQSQKLDFNQVDIQL